MSHVYGRYLSGTYVLKVWRNSVCTVDFIVSRVYRCGMSEVLYKVWVSLVCEWDMCCMSSHARMSRVGVSRVGEKCATVRCMKEASVPPAYRFGGVIFMWRVWKCSPSCIESVKGAICIIRSC